MLLYLFPALVIPFPVTCIIKGNTNNRRKQNSCPFPALMNPFQVIAYISEEPTGCISEEVISAINEASIGAMIAPRNAPSFFSCFHVSVATSINRPESSSIF